MSSLGKDSIQMYLYQSYVQENKVVWLTQMLPLTHFMLSYEINVQHFLQFFVS